MRKLILQEWVTIDGFAAASDGNLDFFAKSTFKNDADQDLLDLMDNVDTILIGTNTYKEFVQYWPVASPKEEVMAEKINTTPKIVFSKSLKEAPWGKWEQASIISEDAIAAIKKLKKKDGKDMVVWGSLSLAKALIEAALIDEYQFFVCPVALGEGTSVFPASSDSSVPFKLTKIKDYDSGLVLTYYEPK